MSEKAALEKVAFFFSPQNSPVEQKGKRED